MAIREPDRDRFLLKGGPPEDSAAKAGDFVVARLDGVEVSLPVGAPDAAITALALSFPSRIASFLACKSWACIQDRQPLSPSVSPAMRLPRRTRSVQSSYQGSQ